MKYGYYPGCSLERNAIAYHQSTLAVAQRLGMEFQEVEDWNCCGATEYISVDLLPAYALVARNLALAADQSPNGGHLVAPCSACFLNLSKADKYLQEDSPLAAKVNEALAAGGLQYTPGTIKTRHLLQVLIEDVGLEAITSMVTRPLYDLRVAAYYGCLVVRPGFLGRYDNPEYPMTLDKLMGILGAEVVDFPLKAHCCGGHMTQISEKVAMDMIHHLLKNAADYEADLIVTLCPMCQLNLDAYQETVNKYYKTNFHLPILYFTQMMGLAFGIPTADLGFGKEFIDATPALAKIGVQAPKVARKERPDKDALPMPRMPQEK